MKFKAKLAKAAWETLDENTRAMYDQLKDDKGSVVEGWMVFNAVESVDGWGFENVGGLKQALAAERQAVSEGGKNFKRLEGLDLDKVLAAYEQYKNAAEWTPSEKAKQEMASREKQLVDKHNLEVSQRDAEVNGLTKEVSRLMVDSEVARCCAPSGATPGSPELVTPWLREKIRVLRSDAGTFETIVLSDDGKTPRISQKAGSTLNMGIEEYLTILREDPRVGRAFDPPTKQKSAGGGGEGFSRKADNTDPQNTNPVERLTAWRQQQAAAGKA